MIGPDGFTRLIKGDAELVRLAQAEGWDAAVQEAEDCGLIHDVFADEMRGRNPYRGDPCDMCSECQRGQTCTGVKR